MSTPPKTLARAMKHLWQCADERGFSEDACADLDDRIKRDGPMDRTGLWRSAQSYMEGELHTESPDWTTVKTLHRVWSEALRWSKTGAP